MIVEHILLTRLRNLWTYFGAADRIHCLDSGWSGRFGHLVSRNLGDNFEVMFFFYSFRPFSRRGALIWTGIAAVLVRTTRRFTVWVAWVVNSRKSLLAGEAVVDTLAKLVCLSSPSVSWRVICLGRIGCFAMESEDRLCRGRRSAVTVVGVPSWMVILRTGKFRRAFIRLVRSPGIFLLAISSSNSIGRFRDAFSISL